MVVSRVEVGLHGDARAAARGRVCRVERACFLHRDEPAAERPGEMLRRVGDERQARVRGQLRVAVVVLDKRQPEDKPPVHFQRLRREMQQRVAQFANVPVLRRVVVRAAARRLLAAPFPQPVRRWSRGVCGVGGLCVSVSVCVRACFSMYACIQVS